MKKPPHVVEIFLQPGEFYFGDSNTRIRTLLGSCVAITIWHPVRLIGGMCHFMLPERMSRPAEILDGRYANEAMQMFNREIHMTGTTVGEYQAKLFGGGNMFGVPAKCGNRAGCNNVACRNVMTARLLLDRQRFKVVAEHVGRYGHRNVMFDIWSGDVWMRHAEREILRDRIEDVESSQCIHHR